MRERHHLIASGNVLFDAPACGAEALRERIHQQMRKLLGDEPVIVFRAVRQLHAIVKADPVGSLTADKRLKLSVFLAGKP